jgi:hypothetical protein
LELRSGNEHLVEGTDRMHAMRTSDDRPSDIELGQALLGIRNCVILDAAASSRFEGRISSGAVEIGTRLEAQ